MDFIFNELSLFATPRNDKEAADWLDKTFNCVIEVSNRRNTAVFVVSNLSFNEILISNSYPFSLWLSTQTDLEYLRIIQSIISKKPFRKTSTSYFYRDIEVFGLGVAYETKSMSISYPYQSNSYFTIVKKGKISSKNRGAIELIDVRNISGRRHINEFFPRRYFEHHKKHDSKRHNLNDGESTLYYDIPNEQNAVERLLASAVQNISGGKLFNYDRNRGKFIEFQEHRRNRFHGYHIENSERIPGQLKRKLLM